MTTKINATCAKCGKQIGPLPAQLVGDQYFHKSCPTELEFELEVRQIHEANRLKTLLTAAYKYNQAGQFVEPTWLEEALELSKKDWNRGATT